MVERGERSCITIIFVHSLKLQAPIFLLRLRSIPPNTLHGNHPISGGLEPQNGVETHQKAAAAEECPGQPHSGEKAWGESKRIAGPSSTRRAARSWRRSRSSCSGHRWQMSWSQCGGGWLQSERDRTKRLLRERVLVLAGRLKEMEEREEEVGKVRVEGDRVLEWKNPSSMAMRSA